MSSPKGDAMKKAVRIFALTVCVLILVATVAFTVPFIGFGKSYEKVSADAAALYGLDINNYQVSFQKTVRNSKGETVQGLIQYNDEKPVIQVQKCWSRPMVIATIFHEFAHAAQYAYSLDTGKLTREQHAEVLSFSVMWSSKYWWNSLHLLPVHMVGKPAEYRATNVLFNIMFTGAKVSF